MELFFDSSEWLGLSAKETRKKVFDTYKKQYQGKSVVNKDLEIEIHFVRSGAKKLAYGGNMYPKKAVLVEKLDKVIEQAVYSNFGERKEKDADIVLGYLNMNLPVVIDNEKEFLHIVLQVRHDRRLYYYTHEINIWKR